MSKMEEAPKIEGMEYDPGRRYPKITSPNAYAAIPFLSEEERALGGGIIAMMDPSLTPGVKQPADHLAVQVRNPLMAMLWDPTLFVAEVAYFDVLAKATFGMTNAELMQGTDESGLKTDDPDIRRRFDAAMLMVAKLAHEFQDEWILRLMSTSPTLAISGEQFAVLGLPRSAVWNDEQRFVLEFTEGVLRRSVTDDLFARAEERWGRLQTLRYYKWITFYVGVNMSSIVDITDAERAGRAGVR